MSELEQQQVELFRRRRFEAPHRRRHPLRRLLRPFAAALAAVGIPALATWWVATSPELQIRAIEAVATQRVPAEWLAPRLADLEGRHLLTVRLGDVERRLGDHPWIADLIVQRQLPGRLRVEVVERTPAALWSGADGVFILDPAGRRIAPLGDGVGELDLPVVSIADLPAGAADEPAAPVAAAAAAAIRLAARWEASSPNDQVSQIEILRSGDYRLVTSRLPFTVVVSADRLEAAPALLERARPLIDQNTLPTLPMSDVASVDLRFSRQIVFQPAAQPPREEG